MSLPAVKLKGLPKEQRGEVMDAVLVSYEDGEEIAELAKKLGVSPTTLYRNLFAERPREWAAAQSARAQHHFEGAKQMMRDAPDNLTLLKGEKLANQARFELERLSPKLYGQKQEPEHLQAVQININLRGENKQVETVVNDASEETPKLAKQ